MTKAQMKDASIRVETLESTPILHTIEIEVDASRVRKAFDRAYRDLAKRVRVKGFRPGKAPRSVLEKLHGASVAEQLEHTLVSETLADAIELAEVQPVSEPAISAGKPTPDANFKYTASIEVSPEIELPDLSGLPAVRPEVSVEEAEVDERLEELRTAHAPLVEEAEGTVLAQGHVATIDFVGRIDGELFEGGSGQGVQLEIGGGRFIPGFEEQLTGAQAGDDREVRVTFPEPYGNAEIAGKDAVFAVHVVDVRKRQPPELDDEFARDVGDFDSLDALRAKIRADLESGQETFEIDILLRQRPAENLHPNSETFRLYVTPIINVFPREGEPIHIDHLKTRYRVLGDYTHPTAFEVVSVDDVTAIRRSDGAKIPRKPFYSFEFGDSSDEFSQEDVYYQVTHTVGTDGGWHTHLALISREQNRLPEPAGGLHRA